jgi:hypothetical protein
MRVGARIASAVSMHLCFCSSFRGRRRRNPESSSFALAVIPAHAGIQRLFSVAVIPAQAGIHFGLFCSLFDTQSFHSPFGRAGNFSLLVQRKVTKRKHTPVARSPRILPSECANALRGSLSALCVLRFPLRTQSPAFAIHGYGARRREMRFNASRVLPPRPCARNELARIVRDPSDSSSARSPRHRGPVRAASCRRSSQRETRPREDSASRKWGAGRS